MDTAKAVANTVMYVYATLLPLPPLSFSLSSISLSLGVSYSLLSSILISIIPSLSHLTLSPLSSSLNFCSGINLVYFILPHFLLLLQQALRLVLVLCPFYLFFKIKRFLTRTNLGAAQQIHVTGSGLHASVGILEQHNLVVTCGANQNIALSLMNAVDQT
jgi:hypothetical protein